MLDSCFSENEEKADIACPIYNNYKALVVHLLLSVFDPELS
jgi:hypothetical protein